MFTLSFDGKSSTIKYSFLMKFRENLIVIVDELIESQSQSGNIRLKPDKERDCIRVIVDGLGEIGIITLEDTEELLSIVGNLDLLVGVRLHALIFAAVMDVPFLGVSYDPKIDRFLETLAETPVGNLESLTAESLFTRIEQSLADQPARQRRRQRVDELRRQALSNAERAIDLVEKKG